MNLDSLSGAGGAEPQVQLASCLERMGDVRSVAVVKEYRRGERIYGPGSSPSLWYRLICGFAREGAVLRDGRHRIVSFALPGDFFGFHQSTKVPLYGDAIVEGTVIESYPSQWVRKVADGNLRIGALVRDMALATISRLHQSVLILGRMTVAEKIAAFLLDMAARSRLANDHSFTLPLSRHDIADHLSVSAETVSRALSELQRGGAVELLNEHRVRILRPDVLERRCNGPIRR